MIDSLFLNITYQCNSRCHFCIADVAYEDAKSGISLKNLIRTFGKKKYTSVCLSGGEPTIHPQIIDIARFCRPRCEVLLIMTHGRRLQDKEFAERLLKTGVNYLMIPLYGPDALSHDHVTQVKGSFDQTVKGFENLACLKDIYPCTVELKLLLSRYTGPLNKAIYHFARDNFTHAIDQISVCPLSYSLSAMDFKDDYLAPFEDLKKDFYSLVKEITEDGLWTLRVNEIPPCFFSSVEMRRLAHPRIILRRPLHVRHFYGDLDSDRLQRSDQNVKDFPTVRGNDLVQCCARCVFQEYCSQLVTPYFSPAYLEQFGETEFHPVTVTGRQPKAMDPEIPLLRKAP